MDGMPLPPPASCDPRPCAWPDAASAGRPGALVVASDPLIAHGVARVLEHAGAIGSAELHGTLETALTGPPVALVIVHPDTPDLTAARAAALVERRRAMALLAAGAGQGSGIAALRSAGARGVLTGAEAPALCARMIELVLAGGSCWTAAPAPRSATMDQGICADRDSIPLTPRQWQVAGELVQGRANKVIGRRLGITEGTVKLHMTPILRVLGVDSRAAAVARLIPMLDPVIGGRVLPASGPQG